MSNEEINKYIHEKILGECWHIWNRPESMRTCTICGLTAGSENRNPDYCSDASPRKLLKEVVGIVTFNSGGSEAVASNLLAKAGAFNGLIANGLGLGSWLSVSAETLARACVETHQTLNPDIEKLREKFLGKN